MRARSCSCLVAPSRGSPFISLRRAVLNGKKGIRSHLGVNHRCPDGSGLGRQGSIVVGFAWAGRGPRRLRVVGEAITFRAWGSKFNHTADATVPRAGAAEEYGRWGRSERISANYARQSEGF